MAAVQQTLLSPGGNSNPLGSAKHNTNLMSKDSLATTASPHRQLTDDQGSVADSTASGEGDQVSTELTTSEHLATIKQGAMFSACAYGLCRVFLSEDRTEDIVDLTHSLYTTTVALRGYSQVERHSLHMCALPPNLADSRSYVVRMLKHSLGYFAADAVLIAGSFIVRQKGPNLWAGRLAHHAVQLFAIYPAVFLKDPAQNLAYRTTMCMAYTAELSSIFLRLSNMARGSSRKGLKRAINWSLVASFFGSRIVNFGLAIRVMILAQPVVAQHLFRMSSAVMCSGYALSFGWFMQILQIALKDK